MFSNNRVGTSITVSHLYRELSCRFPIVEVNVEDILEIKSNFLIYPGPTVLYFDTYHHTMINAANTVLYKVCYTSE